MTTEREGEIALILLKESLLRNGVKLSDETVREIKNKAKRLGISEEEAMEFAEKRVRELVDRVFAHKESR
jgi:hypothetical protein